MPVNQAKTPARLLSLENVRQILCGKVMAIQTSQEISHQTQCCWKNSDSYFCVKRHYL